MPASEAITAIEQQHLEAFKQQDWATLSTLYTENATTIMPDGRAINGRANVIQNFSEMDAVENLRFEIKQCEESGDLCYEVIELKYIDKDNKNCVSEMLQVLKRNADGQWLIQASSYSGPDQTVH